VTERLASAMNCKQINEENPNIESRLKGLYQEDPGSCQNYVPQRDRGTGRVSRGRIWITYNGKRTTISIYRLRYVQLHGYIEEGFHAAHDCQNSRCTNPLHVTARPAKSHMKEDTAHRRRMKALREIAPNAAFCYDVVSSDWLRPDSDTEEMKPVCEVQTTPARSAPIEPNTSDYLKTHERRGTR
jgi:hypothetical protein